MDVPSQHEPKPLGEESQNEGGRLSRYAERLRILRSGAVSKYQTLPGSITPERSPMVAPASPPAVPPRTPNSQYGFPRDLDDTAEELSRLPDSSMAQRSISREYSESSMVVSSPPSAMKRSLNTYLPYNLQTSGTANPSHHYQRLEEHSEASEEQGSTGKSHVPFSPMQQRIAEIGAWGKDKLGVLNKRSPGGAGDSNPSSIVNTPVEYLARSLSWRSGGRKNSDSALLVMVTRGVDCDLAGDPRKDEDGEGSQIIMKLEVELDEGAKGEAEKSGNDRRIVADMGQGFREKGEGIVPGVESGTSTSTLKARSSYPPHSRQHEIQRKEVVRSCPPTLPPLPEPNSSLHVKMASSLSKPRDSAWYDYEYY
ncbi:hypothetical protein BDZ91DRAFT_244167 [Kalaharituber pfeilii]|nr:hypothetical protein BDZ91DRAFT_244167 [Kalaharituber pfeilii]